MTEQGKIKRANVKRNSLFERADEVFGLDKLGPAAVPKGLPDVEPRMRVKAPAPAPEPQPVPAAPVEQQVAPQPAAKPIPQAYQPPKPQPAPAPQPERAVPLSGPRVSVDRERLREKGLIVPEDPVTGLLEEFRIVKRELLADARATSDEAARRIQVCSPLPGEGKTYCALNLAIALAAERDVEVLLIDADVMNPSVPRRLGIEEGQGFMDALVDKSLRPESLTIATDIERLFVLPAGSSSARDAEYLSSARTGQVLDRLTRGAPNRFVIFDTPPALAASPAAELAAHVGQALLVVRADETSRAALEDAQQLLSACPDIKLLLNATRFSPSGRQFGEYGEREE